MSTTTPLRPLLRALLQPVAALCARHGLKVQEVIDAVKTELVAHAERELRDRNAKATLSRLSALTGLQRRDIDRIQKGLPTKRESPNLIFRVMNLWRSDKRFSTRSGGPKVLTLTPETGEFAALIAAVSSDIGPVAVLFEMERLKFVERTPRGVRLLVENFIPRGEDKLVEGSDILSAAVAGLTSTVYSNLVTSPDTPLHHLRTEYDRVRPEGLPHLRNWFLKEGHDLHLRARAEIAKFDQDVNPDPKFTGALAKVSFSSFNQIEPPTDETETRKSGAKTEGEGEEEE